MTSEVQALTGGVDSHAGARAGAGGSRRLARGLPSLVELGAAVAVGLALLPLFDVVAGFGLGRDARYAAGNLAVAGLPEPVLSALCRGLADGADPLLAERLCAGEHRSSAGVAPSELPAELRRALATARLAFGAPLAQAQERLNALQARQREGEDDLRPLADAIGVLEAQIEPYATRYRLAPGSNGGPAALECAVGAVGAGIAQQGALPGSRANALLLLGAALDGRPATAALAGAVALPPALPIAAAPAAAGAPACAPIAESLGAAAGLLGEARQALADARKNEAMRDLLRSAGWQWAGAMGLGYLLLRWSRSRVAPLVGAGVSMLAWAAAGWVARVPWPLTSAREFRPMRLDPAWTAPPDASVIALAAAGVVMLVLGLATGARGRPDRPAQAMSSRVGYAGLMAATGIGWLLLFDLSAHAHPVNRYLVLYHQGHLWLALLVLSVLLFLRQPLARGIGWALSVGAEVARRLAGLFGGFGGWAVLAGIALAGVAVFGLVLANMRQLTSELGRIWLIVGGAWFFFLRAGPLAERLARDGPAAVSFWRYAAPLALVVGVLLAAMLVTRDMGPLLIAGYASGGFVAATLAAWWHQRRGALVLPYAAAVLLFAAWIGAVTLTLFQLGNVDSVTAARLESLAAPFASNNDQLALVSWFQRSTPAGGYGLGAAPWCGHAASGRCAGVPAQVHSDYTFTALVGVFGATAAWAGWVVCALWLHRLIRHHGRVTRGEPRLAQRAGRLADDGQGLLSWIALAWVVLTLCQLAVTVAGNLAVLPLTGVTFPFVSFGMTSLVVNFAFLALCLNLTLPAGPVHG